jgi:hypothetical protein
MTKYAQGTSVPVERSKAEVERILTKYGADQFSSGWMDGKAVVMFRLKGRYIRIEMPTLQTKPSMTASSIETANRENRRRWRALVLYVKAKLESVSSNIVSFEEAFMAHIVLPNRQTVGQFLIPQIAQAYQSGAMPPALPGY